VSEPVAVVVPKELYYHEVGYVRGLEARVAQLEAALREARKMLQWANNEGLLPEEAERTLDLVRSALKGAPQLGD
jgi:hypothetical protein